MITRVSGGAEEITGLLRDWQAFSRTVIESNAPEAQAHDLIQATSELYLRAVWSRMARTAAGSEAASDYSALYRHVQAWPWRGSAAADVRGHR
ncbi:MAG: hypothetical protein ACR2RA_18340 [Geminicoccaceae bacterium]